MGRAIVRDPKIFLFDEPLSNLDAQLRVQMRVEIKQLQQELGTTSLYVTHDRVEAMTLADRLIVMNAGTADQIGPPLTLYQRPATAFVAGFIGAPAMNLIAGEIAEGGISVNGATLAFDGPREPGRRVLVGLRPEHIVLAAGGPLSLRVELAERLGADTIVHGRLAANGPSVTARLPGSAESVPGETLSFAIRAEHVHMFDCDSGRRIE
jgi:sn-glycerol 3-phosphate transport system ATP-binding protein